MEGRTIVRPDRRHRREQQRRRITFNGGPDNRPARRRADQTAARTRRSLQWRAGQSSGQTAAAGSLRLSRYSTFNGGPDNRPARPPSSLGSMIQALILQWRAGQSSGQTSCYFRNIGDTISPSMEGRTIVRPDNEHTDVSISRIVPSMEGRTIVRPDPLPRRSREWRFLSFNGGPDNRPARLVTVRILSSLSLFSFNGGPDNRPARHN